MVLPVTTPLWARLISRTSADFTSGTLQPLSLMGNGGRSPYIKVESGLGNNWIMIYVAIQGSGHIVVDHGMAGFHLGNFENDR